MGIMTAGIASIGNRTIKSLLREFISIDKAFQTKRPTNYTVNSIGTRIKEFIWERYQNEYPENKPRPELEFLICGYDKQSPIPAVYRIYYEENMFKMRKNLDDFGIVFGGQMQEIQRIVFGSDYANRCKIVDRNVSLLLKYHELLTRECRSRGENIDLPLPNTYGSELYFFNEAFDLDGFDARWGDFSEQNAIECVDFFINIMVKSQQFSSRLPTVGGDIHVAVLTKDKGFRYISGEELHHGEHLLEL
jgi:hypothetical protein